MNEHENKQLDVAQGAHTDIIPPRRKRTSGGGLEFLKDLLTGFGALLLFLFIIFVGLPLVMIALKIGVAIAIPILYFGVLVICIALLGRLIRILVFKK